jgi:hypothetical protein
MQARTIGSFVILSLAAFAGGCANDGSGLATASVAPDKVASAPKVDPVCVSLASQIDTLRKEGTVDRLEKAAAGKTANVQIKRTSLAKQAELNKANADFQTRCGPQMPKAQTAQAAPAAAAAIPAPAAAAPATATAAATAQAKSAATSAAATAAAQKN